MKNKKNYKKLLKSLSWIYVVLAVVRGIFAILIATVPHIKEIFVGKIANDDYYPMIAAVETLIIVQILSELWYFWLIKRFCAGKSSGTFFLVLLILGVIEKVSNIIDTKGKFSTSINEITNLVALYWLIRARNE